MISIKRVGLTVLAIALVVAIFWFLGSVVAYVLISAVLALVGRPLMKLLLKIRIGKFAMPSGLAAVLTLGTFLCIIAGFFSLVVPLVVEEARAISTTDMDQVAENFSEPLAELEAILAQYQLSGNPSESNNEYLKNELTSLVDLTSVSDVFGGLVGAFGNVFMTFFSVLFITFFFLKDRFLIANFVFSLTPDRHMEKVKNVLRNARTTLSRYFLGIFLQVATITTLVTIGLTIVGVKNALVIGFFAGIINVIPYIGPLIGAAFGLVITATTNLELEFYNELVPLLGWTALVFAITQVTDNFLLQPLIFSNSVNIHPLEVFLVILVGSALAGIPGMILAVPTYAFLRIIAVEFLSQFKIVQAMKRAEEEDD